MSQIVVHNKPYTIFFFPIEIYTYVARMGEERGFYRVFVGKPEGKSPLGRPRRRWVDNTTMDLKEVGCGLWTGLGWLRIETGGGHL
jgi:hypothetical protein